MTNHSLTRVNQKLAHARVLLKNAEDEGLSTVQTNSILEGSAFHLICAYQHYLRELAEIYGLKQIAGLNDESVLAKALQAAAKHPAEADELMDLRSDQNSWLAQLHTYYNSLWKTPVANESHDEEESLIKVVNLDSNVAVLIVTSSVISGWHAAFVNLVRRQRVTSAEF